MHCTLPILSSLWEPSFYFSATSYSTVGYGDIVPPRVWRLLGPVESVTGVWMCGMSVSFLFVVATKLVERESGAPPDAICKRFGRTFRSGTGKRLLGTARSKSMTDCHSEERSDENLQFGLQASEPI